jgi:3''(2''),5''-bisphosphate nucleotidase, bacterial
MNTESLINIAIKAAVLAGQEILKVYRTEDFEVVSKADYTPVTRADKNAHDKIMEILLPAGLPVLSEEGQHNSYTERQKWDLFWLVDPLDGTKEFIKRNDEFTVNIALVQNHQPIAGIIYVPVFKTIYAGIIGRGSYKISNPSPECTFGNLVSSGEKLPVNIRSNEFVVATSRSHMNEETQNYIDKLKLEHKNLSLTAVGSALKLALIAEGTVDIYPKIGKTMEWDTASGHAILKAVGKNIYFHDLKTGLVYNKENLANPNFVAC